MVWPGAGSQDEDQLCIYYKSQYQNQVEFLTKNVKRQKKPQKKPPRPQSEEIKQALELESDITQILELSYRDI